MQRTIGSSLLSLTLGTLSTLACGPVLLGALAATAFAAPPALALQDDQQDPPKTPDEFPDERPEVAELIEQLEAHVKKRGEEDEQAETVLEQLATEFHNSGPKDRKDILDAAEDCLTVKRKDLAKDMPNDRLAAYAAVMLGRMGNAAGPVLVKYVGHKKLEDKQRAHRAVILALGTTKYEKGVDTLIDALDEEQEALVAAAAQALGNFGEAEQKVRKEIVEELLKLMVPLEDTIEQGQNDPGTPSNEEARKDYEAVRAPALSTLESLTGHAASNFRDWRAWWNDHKKDDWDEAA